MSSSAPPVKETEVLSPSHAPATAFSDLQTSLAPAPRLLVDNVMRMAQELGTVASEAASAAAAASNAATAASAALVRLTAFIQASVATSAASAAAAAATTTTRAVSVSPDSGQGTVRSVSDLVFMTCGSFANARCNYVWRYNRVRK